MARYNIGIDTGGTYTDAVVVDLQNRSILASAKAITTHGDLSIGVAAALGQVLVAGEKPLERSDISLVSISTTLATNALVEGLGASVGSILIGFDDRMVERSRIKEEIPEDRMIRVSGGHDHEGKEFEPLDEALLKTEVERLSGKVDAFSIASLYSVRNATHEHRAKELINEVTDLPVSLSCDLSSDLDVPRRALTATLNAKIISRIVALIQAIKKSLADEGIDARLMVVKGDGSLATAELVEDRPIETIMSGPAASVIGAQFLSGESDFIISDIGGTTTDIATAANGWPETSDSGSVVGDYRTMVNAIEMHTSALGGDTEVLTNHTGNFILGRRRVIPLALLGQRWPTVTERLANALDSGRGLRAASRFILLPEGGNDHQPKAGLDASDKKLLERIGAEARGWSEIITHKGDEERIHRLTALGLVQIGGFTPSDAAHFLGRQSQWCAKTAKLACQVFGRVSGQLSRRDSNNNAALEKFANAVVDAVTRRSAYLLLRELAKEDLAEDNPLIAAVTSGEGAIGNLGVGLNPSVPVIGVGAPAALYYPEVGRRLNTKAIIPANADVANAVGAAVGMVRMKASIEVTGYEAGRFLVHADKDPLVLDSASEAIKTAEKMATAKATERVKAMGGRDLITKTDIKQVELPNNDTKQGIVSAVIRVTCTGYLE